MPIIELSDGTQVELPEGKPAPLTAKDLVNGSVKAGNQTFNYLARGLLKPITGPSTALSIRDGLLGGLGAAMRENRPQFAKDAEAWVEGKRKSADAWVDKTFPREEKRGPLDAPGIGEGPLQNIVGDALEGGTSALLIPFGGPARAAVAGLTAGAGGNIGRRLGEQGGFPVAGEIAGNLLGGTIGGFAAGPKQSVARQDLRRELPPPDSPDWRTALQNAADAKAVGSTTFTAADAFPGRGGILPLASQTAQAQGGEVLRQRLAGRDADLQNLGQTAIANVGPRVQPAIVANEIADAANGFLTGQKQLRSETLANALAGKTVRPQDARDLYDALMAVGKQQTNRNVRDAYFEVANALKSTSGEIQRSVQDLSLTIKSFKDAAKNPQSLVPGYTQIQAGWGKPAIADAESGLAEISPAWESAMQDFKGFTKKGLASPFSLENLAEGPIGRLADTNPNIQRPTPLGRLEGLFTGNSPAEVQKTARVLSDPLMTGGATVNPRDIASALMQERLGKGSTNPGALVRGMAGSDEAQKLDALIRAGGGNPEQVLKPLRVADQMQNLDSAGRLTKEIRPGMGNWVRPFRALDMLLTGKSQEKVTAEIARLIADPANIPELQKIAMFNPMVRRAMTAVGGTMPALRAYNQGQEN